jgi:hypothetical protein
MQQTVPAQLFRRYKSNCLFSHRDDGGTEPANVCTLLVVTEHRGLVSPAIVEHTGTVHVAQDEGAVLLCVSQGCPTPDYR